MTESAPTDSSGRSHGTLADARSAVARSAVSTRSMRHMRPPIVHGCSRCIVGEGLAQRCEARETDGHAAQLSSRFSRLRRERIAAVLRFGAPMAGSGSRVHPIRRPDTLTDPNHGRSQLMKNCIRLIFGLRDNPKDDRVPFILRSGTSSPSGLGNTPDTTVLYWNDGCSKL